MSTQDPNSESRGLSQRSASAADPSGSDRRRRFDRDRDPVEFGRIVTLTDGVFAIALTLLVLDLSLPGDVASGSLRDALVALEPRLIAFVVSVAVVGTFFHSHHELVRMLQAFDGTLLGLTIPYLGLVALIPFVQRLISDAVRDPLAFAVYGAVLGLAAAVEAIMLWHAHRRGLLRQPLHGRPARLQVARSALPVVVFFVSVGLASLLGAWTILLWFSLWPLDSLLVRFAQRGRSPGSWWRARAARRGS